MLYQRKADIATFFRSLDEEEEEYLAELIATEGSEAIHYTLRDYLGMGDDDDDDS